MMKSLINGDFFSRLETLALNLNANLSGFFGGKHRTRSYGQTVEFADYREYMLGDDIRRIDWNLYSRFEKYFLRLFTDERQMHTQIFLDCSASMGVIDQNKAAYATAIAAALGFLSVHNMDKLSFKLMKGKAAEDNFGTIVGKSAFFRAISQLESMSYSDEADIASAVISCPNVGSKDGLTVIISDFYGEDSWKKAVDYLCFKKRQVLLVQVLTPEEFDPSYSGRINLIDSESVDVSDGRNLKLKITRAMHKAYEEALRDFQQDIRSFCTSRGAGYAFVRSDRPIEKVLFSELLKIGIMA